MKMRVKPAQEGALIRQPERNLIPLPAEGALVPCNQFWMRRVAAGDVERLPDEIKVEAPEQPKEKKKRSSRSSSSSEE